MLNLSELFLKIKDMYMCMIMEIRYFYGKYSTRPFDNFYTILDFDMQTYLRWFLESILEIKNTIIFVYLHVPVAKAPLINPRI